MRLHYALPALLAMARIASASHPLLPRQRDSSEGDNSSSSEDGNSNNSVTTPTSSSLPKTTSTSSSRPPPTSEPDVTRVVTVTVDGKDITVTRATTAVVTVNVVATLTSTEFVTTTITESNVDTATSTIYVTSTIDANAANAKRAAQITPVPTTSSPARWLAKRDTVTRTTTVAKDAETKTVVTTHESTTSRTSTTEVTETSTVKTTRFLDASTTITTTSTIFVTRGGGSQTTSTSTPDASGDNGNNNNNSNNNDNGGGGGLSTGAKAGIGIGASVAGLLLLGALVFWLRRRHQNKPKILTEDFHNGGSEVPVSPTLPNVGPAGPTAYRSASSNTRPLGAYDTPPMTTAATGADAYGGANDYPAMQQTAGYTPAATASSYGGPQQQQQQPVPEVYEPQELYGYDDRQSPIENQTAYGGNGNGAGYAPGSNVVELPGGEQRQFTPYRPPGGAPY